MNKYFLLLVALLWPLSLGAQASGSIGVPVSGNGSSPPITMSGPLTFGNEVVGTTSPPHIETVKNTSAAAVTITSIGFSGDPSSQFAQTNTCGASLAAGATCTISVTYSPTVAGPVTATLTVNWSQ